MTKFQCAFFKQQIVCRMIPFNISFKGHYMMLVPGLGVSNTKPLLVGPKLPVTSSGCVMEMKVFLPPTSDSKWIHL